MNYLPSSKYTLKEQNVCLISNRFQIFEKKHSSCGDKTLNIKINQKSVFQLSPSVHKSAMS